MSSAAAVFDTSKASPVKMVENIEKLVNGKFKARIQVRNSSLELMNERIEVHFFKVISSVSDRDKVLYIVFLDKKFIGKDRYD